MHVCSAQALQIIIFLTSVPPSYTCSWYRCIDNNNDNDCFNMPCFDTSHRIGLIIVMCFVISCPNKAHQTHSGKLMAYLN